MLTQKLSMLATHLVMVAASADKFPPRMPVKSLPGLDLSSSPYEFFSGFLDAGTPPSGRGKM